MSRIQAFSRSRFFVATVIAAVVLTVIYIFGTAIYRYRRAQRQQRYPRYRRK